MQGNALFKAPTGFMLHYGIRLIAAIDIESKEMADPLLLYIDVGGRAFRAFN